MTEGHEPRKRPLYDVVIGNVLIGGMVLYVLVLVVTGEIGLTRSDLALSAVMLACVLALRIPSLPSWIQTSLVLIVLGAVAYGVYGFISIFVP